MGLDLCIKFAEEKSRKRSVVTAGAFIDSLWTRSYNVPFSKVLTRDLDSRPAKASTEWDQRSHHQSTTQGIVVTRSLEQRSWCFTPEYAVKAIIDKMVLCLRPTSVIKELRLQCRLERPAIYLRSPAAVRRQHVSSNSTSGPATTSRKQVTVLSDDGRVQWQDLTRFEKVARTTQQTFNFGLILGGFFLTVCLVLYFEYLHC